MKIACYSCLFFLLGVAFEVKASAAQGEYTISLYDSAGNPQPSGGNICLTKGNIAYATQPALGTKREGGWDEKLGRVFIRLERVVLSKNMIDKVSVATLEQLNATTLIGHQIGWTLGSPSTSSGYKIKLERIQDSCSPKP